jgi:hypothetical protein
VRKGPAIALIAAMLAASHARADEAEPIRLEWVADAGCPTADDFWTSLAERTDRMRRAGDEAARVFHVELHASGTRFDGSLRITDVDATTSSRRASAATCEGAAEALAFFAALAIDPNAHERRPIVPRTEPATRPVAPEPITPPRRPRRHTPPPTPSSWIVRAAFGAGPGLLLGVLPSARIEAVGAIAVDASKSAWWAPGARLSVLHASSGSIATTSGDYAIAWTVAALDLCALRVGTPSIEARLCASGELGAIHGEGFAVDVPAAQTHVWGALGGAARGRVLVSRVIGLELRAALLGPLVRDRFHFADGATVHEVPPLGARLEGALFFVLP